MSLEFSNWIFEYGPTVATTAAVFGFLFAICCVLVEIVAPRGTYISWGNDPFVDCPDCQGSGIVLDDVDCPCTMRVHSC